MNENLKELEVDWLFHFGLEFPRDKKSFEGVKFICTGGSAGRLKKVSYHKMQTYLLKTSKIFYYSCNSSLLKLLDRNSKLKTIWSIWLLMVVFVFTG